MYFSFLFFSFFFFGERGKGGGDGRGGCIFEAKRLLTFSPHRMGASFEMGASSRLGA